MVRALLWLCVLALAWPAAAAVRSYAPIEPWLAAGWQALEQRGLDAAIAVWQRGVDRLPPDRLLLSPIGIFPDQLAALRGVRRLGVEFRGLVLRARFHGRPHYFVLSAPMPDELEGVRRHLEELLSGGRRHIFGWSAARFQPGGSLALAGGVPEVDGPAARGSRHERASAPEVTGLARSAPVASAVVRADRGSRRVQATPEQEAQLLMGMARSARQRGERKQAIALLYQVLKRTPNHARARLMAGELLVADGRYDEAWQVLRPLLREESLDWKPWFWSGTAELMAGRLDAAADHLDGALARDGRIAAVWVQRALVAQQRRRFAVAFQLLKVAEAMAPKSPQVMLNLGYTLDAMGRRQAAVDYYRRYLLAAAGDARRWRARKAVIDRLAHLGAGPGAGPAEKVRAGEE
ncbi:MAG: hypothetical protein D6682_02185 [Zetaproteobacteria bacterium]|nr:MAG: hypothetical protein D6682_02185 [Zetaproteobacteria bacterium]